MIRTQMSTDCRLPTSYQQRCEKKMLTRISRGDFREIPTYFDVCSVCTTRVGELVKTCIGNRQNVRSVEGLSGRLVVDKCGKIGNWYHVCNTCAASLKSGNLPKAVILNGFDVSCNHDMPHYLKNLTETEEMLIAKFRPIGKVRKLGKVWNSSVNYQQISGHVIVIPEEVSTIYKLLPSRALFQLLAEVVKVIWVRKE